MASPRSASDLRWACSGCGACCRAGYALGPVTDDEVARLEASGIRDRWAPAADGFHDRREERGRTANFLRTADGACVFLRPDNLCAVHAEVGAALKPWFCRQYPFQSIADDVGPVVVARPSCQGFHHAAATGPELSPDDLAAIDALVPPGVRRRFDPPVVPILPGRGASRDDWMYLEGRIVDAAARSDGPWDAVRAIRGELQRGLRGGWPDPDADRAESALHRALSPIYGLLLEVDADPGGTTPTRERVRAVLRVIERASEAPDREPALTPEAAAYVGLHLRMAILGKEIHALGAAAVGIGAFLLGVDAVARAWPERPVPVEAFGPPWAMWYDVMNNRYVHGVRVEAAPAILDRFLHL